MNGHGVSDGKHNRTSAAELMVPGAGRGRLHRRHLLGGVVAGAAGLLLGRPAAAQAPEPSVQESGASPPHLIRFGVINRQWGNNAHLEAYWPHYANF